METYNIYVPIDEKCKNVFQDMKNKFDSLELQEIFDDHSMNVSVNEQQSDDFTDYLDEHKYSYNLV